LPGRNISEDQVLVVDTIELNTRNSMNASALGRDFNAALAHDFEGERLPSLIIYRLDRFSLEK
jgi:hypothetical protein